MVERIRDDLNIQIETLDNEEEKTTSDSIQEPLKSTKNEINLAKSLEAAFAMAPSFLDFDLGPPAVINETPIGKKKVVQFEEPDQPEFIDVATQTIELEMIDF